MDLSNTTLIILLVVVLAVLLGIASMVMARRRRTRRLQERFGPEYDHALETAGDETQAERELEDRIEQKDALDLRELSAEEVNRYALDWQEVQRQFVDEPLSSVQKADRLIREAMKSKGYPVEDFEERAALLSVDYPELVQAYRGLHRIAAKESTADVNTEDMRQAMLHARALFEGLVRSESRDEHVDQKERI